MRDEEFECDDDKAIVNIARHGIRFEPARRVFDDVFVVERKDHRQDYGEDRYTAIGKVAGRLIFVVYTMRGERIRIIMARLAEPFEKR